MPDNEVFQNIEHKNKVVSKPIPSKMNDIDTHNILYKNIIDGVESSTLDLNSISSLTNISQTRDNIYNMIDIMCEDPIINAAVNIYTADACEPNEEGQVVWAVSDDDKISGAINYLLDQMSVDKNAYNWMHSLVKYGDIYLRLYRNSEYNDPIFGEDKKDNTLNEDVILKTYKQNDHYAEYMELLKNPAELFDLQRFGKTVGYIRSHVMPSNLNADYSEVFKNMMQYNFKKNDVDLYNATEFVHACLEDISSRTSEEVSITTGQEDDDTKTVYTVKRGQSILYNLFRIWRELSLLENSIMLNRITRSSVVKTVSVEVGDMEKNDVRNLLQRIKSMVEQKSTISVGNTFEDYTNPGPIENIIYVPTHDGKGVITMGEIGGGNAEGSGDLNDLSYFKNKLNAGLGIPGAFLGESDTDGSLFNNGNSLALKSSIYAKTVKRIQNAFIQAITDAVNLMLLDKGLNDYIGEFQIKMQTPTTQEEKDRKENLSNSLNNIDTIMRLIEPVEDQKIKLEILKSLLSNTISDVDVISAIQDQIDILDQTGGVGNLESEDMGGEFGGDLGGGDFGSEPMEMPEEPMEGGEEAPAEGTESEPMEMPEEPEESFYNGSGEILNEEDNLPSFADLGISYNQVKVHN